MVGKGEMFKVREPRWSKALSRTKWIMISFFKQWREYGFNVAWHGFIWWVSIYAKCPTVSAKALASLTKSLDAYFERNYKDIISKYIDSSDNNIIESNNIIPVQDYPIWCFWWQGEENMPQIVRSCFLRIKRNNKNVILITQSNIREFVHLSHEIYEKVSIGKISYTHLSDILRLTLLANHGGMWIDVTCFNPYSIPDYAKQLLFCSPHDVYKQKNQKQVTYWCDLGGWRSWNIGTNIRNSVLFSFCRDMIQTIALRQNCMPNYFMVDCLLNYAYRKLTGVKQTIDNLPDINTKCADLFLYYFNTNRPWNESEYSKLIENDWMFKLTYKTVWLETVNGKVTFYGKLFADNSNLR